MMKSWNVQRGCNTALSWNKKVPWRISVSETKLAKTTSRSCDQTQLMEALAKQELLNFQGATRSCSTSCSRISKSLDLSSGLLSFNKPPFSTIAPQVSKFYWAEDLRRLSSFAHQTFLKSNLHIKEGGVLASWWAIMALERTWFTHWSSATWSLRDIAGLSLGFRRLSL